VGRATSYHQKFPKHREKKQNIPNRFLGVCASNKGRYSRGDRQGFRVARPIANEWSYIVTSLRFGRHSIFLTFVSAS